MLSTLVGEVTCKQCGTVNTSTKVMEISEDDIHGSLIYCTHCEKYTRWE